LYNAEEGRSSKGRVSILVLCWINVIPCVLRT